LSNPVNKRTEKRQTPVKTAISLPEMNMV